MKKLIFNALAQVEYVELNEYYQSVSSGVGERFVRAVDRTLDRIRRFPQANPRLIASFRGAVISRFPIAIVYTVHRQFIRIVSFHHLRRGHFQWLSP
jgi:hypothetical protein